MLFYLAYNLFYGYAGNDAFGGGFAFFSLAYFALFFISFSLALVHENFIVQFIWAGIALYGYLAICLMIITMGFSWKFNMPPTWIGTRIWQDLSYDIPTLLSSIVVFLVMSTPFIASFFLAFKKFDLRPVQVFNRRQMLFFIPLLLLALAVSLAVCYIVQKKLIF